MIIWAIFVFWAPGVQSNHNAEIVSLQTFQSGDNVTIKCFLTKNSFGNTMVWYKQNIGQTPLPITLSYSYWKNIEFMDDFKNGRFSILASGESFHLQITATTKEDAGIYYCGTVFLNLIRFVSGVHLMLKGTESKCFNMTCEERPIANGTTLKNADSSSQEVPDPVLISLIVSNVVFVTVISALLCDYCKRRRKWQSGSANPTSASCKTGDSDMNNAAVRFASVPPARRANNKHQSEYSEVIFRPIDHMV